MSIDLDFSSVLSTASDLINGLWPVFVVPIGLSLAFGLITWIYQAIVKRLPTM
jgi:nitrate reductase NapE component